MKTVPVRFALDCMLLSVEEGQRRLATARKRIKDKLVLKEVSTKTGRRLGQRLAICIDREAHFPDLHEVMEEMLEALQLEWAVVWVKPARETHFIPYSAYIEEAMGGDCRTASRPERHRARQRV
jgi:hypothetical protein